jgi:hypothetical protein
MGVSVIERRLLGDVTGSGGARQLLSYSPITVRALLIEKDNSRIALAILVAPHLRRIVMTRFFRVAITRGALPDRFAYERP